MTQQTERLATTTQDVTDELARRVTNTAPVTNEACNIIISQAEQWLLKSDHLIAAYLVDSSFFSVYF